MRKYRPEIDGLRAVAVIAVILFHAGFQTFSGGFIGVDIFFVISGYLITSIILNENEKTTFSLVNFYERRARRILPALFFVMFVCLLASWFLLLPADMKDFSQSLMAVTGFVSNIFFWQTSGYFATAAELKPLLHTWSLAVEEQYYVFFPLFLILTWKLNKRWILPVLFLAAMLSLALAQWGAYHKPDAAFYLLPTRGWELLMGALIACYFSSREKIKIDGTVAQVGSILGVLLIIYAIFFFEKFTPHPSIYTLIPTIGSGLTITFATEETIVGEMLSSKPLVGMGLISYSAYLWHQPIFAFVRQESLGDPSKWLLMGLALVSILLAYFSWKYVELPFRDKRLFGRRQIFTYSAIGSVLFASIGFAGNYANGFLSRYPAEAHEVLNYGFYPHKDLYREEKCFLKTAQTFKDFSTACANVSKEPEALLWGDSHAAALSVGLRKEFPDLVQYTASACLPMKDARVSWRPNCKGINDFVISEIKRLQPKRLFIHANWVLYKGQNPTRNMHTTVEYIHGISPNTKITLIGSVPQWIYPLPVVMYKNDMSLDKERYLANVTIKDFAELDKLFRDEIKRYKYVKYFSPVESLCTNNACLATTAYHNTIMPTAWDYGHLTEGGSVLLAKALMK